jgi:hypothetical protein
MTNPPELVATFQPIIEDMRAEIDRGIRDSRAMELEIELRIELRRYDLAAGAVGETADVTAFREEIKAQLERLAKGRSMNLRANGSPVSSGGMSSRVGTAS